MSEAARLCDITTEPGSAAVEPFNFIIGNVPGLDGLEYHLGLSRGEITQYTNMMTTPLHHDMIKLFRSSSWALLSASDVIEKMWDLYSFNQSLSTATLARKKFTEVFPESSDKLYQYELLPVCTSDKLPIYVGEKRYDYPYHNFPLVESSIHPCFVLKSLSKYLVRGNLDYAPNSLTDDPQRRSLIGSIGITASLCVNLSWLHGTWEDFSDRPAVLARPDPILKEEEPEAPVVNETVNYATDEPRDLYDPRALFVLDAMDKYVAKHNKRIEVEEAERKAQHTPLVIEQPIPSDSSMESINSTVVEPPSTGPPRAKSAIVQPVVTSEKRTRSAASSSAGSSVEETPSKRPRSTSKRETLKKKSPPRSSPAVEASAPPPLGVRRSTRNRKVVSR